MRRYYPLRPRPLQWQVYWTCPGRGINYERDIIVRATSEASARLQVHRMADRPGEPDINITRVEALG